MLTPDIAPDVVAQCQIAAGEIGQAFARAFGQPIEATVDEPISLHLLEAPEELESPGVIVTLHFGLSALVVLVPQAGGLLPREYDSADSKAQSNLTTLAQELGMLVLPESLLAEDAEGFCVASLASALREGGAPENVSLVNLSLKSGGKQASAFIIWPLTSARQITKVRDARGVGGLPARHAQLEASGIGTTPTEANDTESLAGGSFGDIASDVDSAGSGPATGVAASDPVRRDATDDAQSAATSASKKKVGRRGPSLRDLPPYSRSLLKIRVPLSVTLAEKKQPLGQILEIGPGSILQFEKSCEDMLDLNVSNLAIARGEAVKVGDKFGLRVTSLILPSERFKAVQPTTHQSMPIST
jgi:flagellar motor switch protein FliN